MTTLGRFLQDAAAGRLVPVWRDCLLDADTPVSAFAKLRRDPFAFLLESAPAGGETWARYTFLGTEPRRAWRLHDRTVEEWTPEHGWLPGVEHADPLAALRERLTEFEPVAVPELGEFWTGAVGYFGYDVVRLIERLPNAPARELRVPDAMFVFTRALVVIDNLRSQARVVVGVPVDAALAADPDRLRDAHAAAHAEIDAVIARLREPSALPPLQLEGGVPPAEGTSSVSRERFMRGVERIREYILAGDCFQALLSRRIDVARDFDGTTLYRTLRVLNPSPYMFHLAMDGVELVGSSPELLVRVANGTVTVRPIAGTRRRGATPDEDAALAEELAGDEKERAEHVMLVDLGRNDVGRLARYGTVRVTDFMTVERYSHVLHLVSQVDGEIGADDSAIEAFRATFPAGTMTGAPKVRAMEIIDELEPQRRGPYAGALGYIAAGDRRMDLAITIRTCLLAGDRASIQAGAGIVADSRPEREWEETEEKARAMLTAIAQARRATRQAELGAGARG